MDKIKAFLSTAASKVTTWVAAALVVISQVQPVLEWVQGLVGQLNPGKALALGAVLTWLGRIRGILADAAAKLGSTPPAP